jgi:hypothetical protein
MNYSSRLRIATREQLIQLLFRQILACILSERIGPYFAQSGAPVLDNVSKRALAGAIAEKPFVVLELHVIAVDIDGGQAPRAMGGDGRQCILC